MLLCQRQADILILDVYRKTCAFLIHRPLPLDRPRMPTRLIQRHDQFAKYILDQPGNAEAFCRERLPAPVVARLSTKPAVDRSASFIDPTLAEARGDRVWSLETVDGETVHVWTYVEHKSAPEPDTLIQTLRILTGIACDGASRRENPDRTVWIVPAAVYPVILYHGTERWPLPTELAQAYPLPAELVGRGLLSFIYTLVNLIEIPDDQLSNHPPLRAALMVLKYSLFDEDPRVTLRRLIGAAAALGLPTIIVVVRYLFKESAWLDREMLRAELAEVLPGQEEAVLSPAAQEIIAEARPAILAEGEAKGEIRGEAKGEAKGRAEMLLRQFRRKFGAVPDAAVARVRAAGIEQLDDWSERFVDAATLDEVFADDRPQ